VIDNRDDLDSWHMSDIRACWDVHPVGDVRGVMLRKFYLAAREILKLTEKCLLEGLSEEDAKGGLLDNMCMNLEQNIAYLWH